MPHSWEHRLTLYCAHLVYNEHLQSSTLKSYVSAIKDVLLTDGYELIVDKFILSTLISSCKQINDVVRTRLPIMTGLLEIILFETQRMFRDTQPYLELLYKNIFSTLFYSLFRIGEITLSAHTIKAKDIHVSHSKKKILFVLYSSKTHGKESNTQKIRISSQHDLGYFCPFKLSRKYQRVRGGYICDDEPYFIFSDHTPVRPANVRCVLQNILQRLKLDKKLYGTHSFRIGRATELFRKGVSLEKIKQMGRWRSNAVYKYLRS